MTMHSWYVHKELKKCRSHNTVVKNPIFTISRSMISMSEALGSTSFINQVKADISSVIQSGSWKNSTKLAIFNERRHHCQCFGKSPELVTWPSDTSGVNQTFASPVKTDLNPRIPDVWFLRVFIYFPWIIILLTLYFCNAKDIHYNLNMFMNNKVLLSGTHLFPWLNIFEFVHKIYVWDIQLLKNLKRNKLFCSNKGTWGMNGLTTTK